MLELCFDVRSVLMGLTNSLKEGAKDVAVGTHAIVTGQTGKRGLKRDVTTVLRETEMRDPNAKFVMPEDDELDDSPDNGAGFSAKVESIVGDPNAADSSTTEESTLGSLDGIVGVVGKEEKQTDTASAEESEDEHHAARKKIAVNKKKTKKGLGWISKIVGETCSLLAATNSLELKMCIPITFVINHHLIPHPGLSMIANAGTLKCIKTALLTIVGKIASTFSFVLDCCVDAF